MLTGHTAVPWWVSFSRGDMDRAATKAVFHELLGTDRPHRFLMVEVIVGGPVRDRRLFTR